MLTRRAFLSGVAGAVAVSGCSRSELTSSDPRQNSTAGVTGATASKDTARLRVTASHSPALCRIGWTVAHQKGFFAAEGLDVDLLPAEMDPHAALEHGIPLERWVRGPAGRLRADVTIVEYPHLAPMAAGTMDYYVVAGEHSGCRQLVVPVGSAIRTLADLKGKRIGASTVEHISMFEYLFRQAGLRAKDITWIRLPVAMGSPEQLASVTEEFTSGRLDGYITADPVGEILKVDGLVRHLASNTWTNPLSGWYCCMIAVRREVLDAHPEVGRAVTRGIRRAAAFIEADPVAAVDLAIAAGHLPKDTRRDLSAKLLTEYVWTATGRIQEDVERYFQLLIEDGTVPATASAQELVKRVYRSGEQLV